MNTTFTDKDGKKDRFEPIMFQDYQMAIIKGVNPQIKRENPDNCVCGNPVLFYETNSKTYGRLSMYPSSCEQCRAKAYAVYLEEKHRQDHGTRRDRCGENQNRFITHGNVEIGLKNYKKLSTQSAAFDYVNSVLNGTYNCGAFFYGPTGTGKTFLAKILNNELVAQYRDVCFMKAVDLAMLLRKSGFGDGGGEVIQDLRRIDILIIDDYGTQKNTEFIKEAIFSIFDYRYDNNKTTIITSNLSEEDLEESDRRLASRIGDKKWMQKFLIKSQDLRSVNSWSDLQS